MPATLQSFLNGQWQRGEGVEAELRNPVSGELLGTASARKLDLAGALDQVRVSPAGDRLKIDAPVSQDQLLSLIKTRALASPM